MEIIQKIVDLLEEHDVRIISTQEQNGKYVTECEFWSDAGENVIVDIYHKESAKSFVDGWKEYSYDFDPDEHAEAWVSERGKNGVSNSIRELIDDADAIAKKLEDIANALAKLTFAPTAQEIYDVSDEIKREAEIRSDWAAALRSVKDGSDLSADIRYGFSELDLSILAKLHKRNRFRTKIEDLLEDCNFHAECSDFSEGNYSKYIR